MSLGSSTVRELVLDVRKNLVHGFSLLALDQCSVATGQFYCSFPVTVLQSSEDNMRVPCGPLDKPDPASSLTGLESINPY